MENQKRIVLARIVNTGFRKTGRMIRPDGINWVEETESAEKAESCNWGIYSEKALDKAKEFASREGYKVFVLPDSENVLQIAREKVSRN